MDMKKVSLYGCLFWALTNVAVAQNCDLVYDEYDSLMNKQFLLRPEKFVKVQNNRLSPQDLSKLQKNKFLLSNQHKGLGIAIVQTNKNKYGKLLFSWRRTKDRGLLLVIKEATLFGRVNDGARPKNLKNINIKSSYTLDLDTGKTGGSNADIWFHNVNGKEMYIEAINGAKIKFPISSLCKPKFATLTAVLPKFQAAQFNSAGKNDKRLKQIVKREILPNGNVIINFSDKSKIERFKGGIKRTPPNGQPTTMLFSTAAPAAFPVGDPDDGERFFLELHRGNLLNIIHSLIGDPVQVQQFIDSSDNSGNIYQSIMTRSDTIQKLVAP